MQKRIQVYADEEVKRRIELAAAKFDLPVTEYCMQAIRQRLRDEDLLEQAQIEIAIKPKKQDNFIERLRTLHASILAYHNSTSIDVDGLLDRVREERDYELTSVY